MRQKTSARSALKQPLNPILYNSSILPDHYLIFLAIYRDLEKLQPLVAEIGWTKNLVILEKYKDPREREFYILMTRKFGWTKSTLIQQIESRTFEKTVLNQTNFEKTLPSKIRDQAKFAVKDEYSFDFLELGDEFSERELESAILTRIQPFLREMGGMFAFIGSQYRLEVDGEEFLVDLLLFHRRLKCLVAVELKIGKFIPEYIGKMQFYLTALDKQERVRGENPSIGIILCRSKSKVIVEYTLNDTSKPIGVGAYQVVSKLPSHLEGELPDPAQIERLLEVLKEG